MKSSAAEIGANWLIFHLLVRDFFHFLCRKYGSRIFFKGGAKNVPVSWRNDPEAVQRWKEGTTGVPLVDANMRELGATGWMSNRGRQIVASYLIHDLQVRGGKVDEQGGSRRAFV